MSVRAVIFDVYETLLAVDRLPADAESRWQQLCQTMLGRPARLSLPDFSAACDRVIARHHAAARAIGVSFPEVWWPDIVMEVLPEVAQLSARQQDDFFYEQAQVWHTVRLRPEAAAVLQDLIRRGVRLGIASNAQAYTVRELDRELTAAGLAPATFTPSLCFWSFEHGFSKPDPHVFRLLTARLHGVGITPAETLMVGDRMDNDIEPARAHGWQTWLLCSNEESAGRDQGDWPHLTAALAGRIGAPGGP